MCARSCCAVTVVLVSALSVLPRRQEVESLQLRGDVVPVVSFNIRYETKERDDRNDFRHRRHRIAEFLNSTAPWFVGLQEALTSQAVELTRLLPRYALVGFRGTDATDPKKEFTFKTGILYDTSKLELLEHEHVWLSVTPSVPGSKSWGSRQPRTLTIGAFRSRHASSVEVVAFNTHLDVWCARARHEQARFMSELSRKWMRRYPNAVFFAMGDFNSVNGQTAHRLLTEDFSDAWDTCVSCEGCAVAPFAATFHGWLGSVVDRYLSRMLQFALFSLHGSGVEMPTHVPGSVRELMRMVKQILLQLAVPGNLKADWPSSLQRLHVDWVLFRNARPVHVYVGDVRDWNFSSDHFPLVAVFEFEVA